MVKMCYLPRVAKPSGLECNQEVLDEDRVLFITNLLRVVNETSE